MRSFDNISSSLLQFFPSLPPSFSLSLSLSLSLSPLLSHSFSYPLSGSLDGLQAALPRLQSLVAQDNGIAGISRAPCPDLWHLDLAHNKVEREKRGKRGERGRGEGENTVGERGLFDFLKMRLALVLCSLSSFPLFNFFSLTPLSPSFSPSLSHSPPLYLLL